MGISLSLVSTVDGEPWRHSLVFCQDNCNHLKLGSLLPASATSHPTIKPPWKKNAKYTNIIAYRLMLSHKSSCLHPNPSMCMHTHTHTHTHTPLHIPWNKTDGNLRETESLIVFFTKALVLRLKIHPFLGDWSPHRSPLREV